MERAGLTSPTVKLGLTVLLSASWITACREDSVTAPFGLRLREEPGSGSVAEAIHRDAAERPACPSLPDLDARWPVRTLSSPSGRVALPARLVSATAPSSEVTFLAPDMSAGAFVARAPSLASIEVPEDSPLAGSPMTTCRVRIGTIESVVYLMSQPHPARSGDSVHLAFVQVALAGAGAVRGGAFATTRSVRDSLVRALLAVELVPE